MQKYKFCLIAVLLTSCTNELPDAPEQEVQEQGTPVHFAYTVEPQVSITTDSRTVIEGTDLSTAPDTYVGMFALRGTGTGTDFVPTSYPTEMWNRGNFQNRFFNEKYGHTEQNQTSGQDSKYNRNLVSANAGLMPAGDERLRFFAYYPYTENIDFTSGTAVPKVPITLNNDLTETPDYLYTGFIDDYVKDAYINVPFKHVLGRFQIYVNANKAVPVPLTCSITRFEIILYGYQHGNINLETGYIEMDGTGNGSYDFTCELNSNNKISSTAWPTKANLDVLLFPNTNDKGIMDSNLEMSLIYQIIMTVSDGKSYTVYDGTQVADADKIRIQRGKTTKLYLTYNYK